VSCQRARIRCSIIAALLATVSVLALPQSQAFGAGGKSIESASAVVYGQQEFGNTAEGSYLTSSCGLFGGFAGCCEHAYRSFWSLSVVAGDQLTIDWESQALETELKLAPVGTTDYTLFQTELAAEQSLASNGKNQLTYKPPQSGVMPLYFRQCGNTPGPYDFVATDQHALVVSLDRTSYVTLNTGVTAHASLADGTPVPNGMAFWLNAYWPRHGFANYEAKSSGGNLRFRLALPPSTIGKTVTLVVVRLAGAEYLATKSTSIRPHVNPPKPTHSPPRHGRHHHHHHHHH
jgi:hypothetical protein